MKKGETVKPWKTSEIEYMKAHIQDMTYAEIAEKLGRTQGAIKQQAVLQRILKREAFPQWTEQEEDFLRENAKKMSVRQLADRLGRSEQAVFEKMHRKGISGRKQWTQAEDDFLLNGIDKKPLPELAEACGVDIIKAAARISLLVRFRRKES